MSNSPAEDLPLGVEQVLSVLRENKASFHLRIFNESAHHASQAAALLECELGAVVKSLVFTSMDQEDIFIVLVSGNNRVLSSRLNTILERIVKPAKPDVVLRRTGYPVGGVPPFGFGREFPVIIDADLLDHAFLWASAGAISALVGIKPETLQLITQGRVCTIH